MIWHDNDYFKGLELFDKNNVKLFEPSRKKYKTYSWKEYFIGDNERIVGVRSRAQSQGSAVHFDLQLIIGRME